MTIRNRKIINFFLFTRDKINKGFNTFLIIIKYIIIKLFLYLHRALNIATSENLKLTIKYKINRYYTISKLIKNLKYWLKKNQAHNNISLINIVIFYLIPLLLAPILKIIIKPEFRLSVLQELKKNKEIKEQIKQIAYRYFKEASNSKPPVPPFQEATELSKTTQHIYNDLTKAIIVYQRDYIRNI
ncbi:MAG: hypothetical protein O7C59_10910 [Rickettsia endosymbiont of Ixodes persulcatus]|nr:hypothetical protein [Rickettsia endosymbiont of Ixodes persulcatus]MCZ6914889.1 hypothetical protein [Rickettsia endosymbiont of Ixodes persulcatus]